MAMRAHRRTPRPVKRPRARSISSDMRALPPSELAGLLDGVKATVLALLASLQEKERNLRRRLRTAATPGVRAGLSDIRLLRRWADRTLRTIALLERGQQRGDLRALLADLGEFRDIVRVQDADVTPLHELH
jgi:hypothetical protein